MNREQRRLSQKKSGDLKENKKKAKSEADGHKKLQREFAAMNEIQMYRIEVMRDNQSEWVKKVARFIKPPEWWYHFIGGIQKFVTIIIIGSTGWITVNWMDGLARLVMKLGFSYELTKIDEYQVKCTVKKFGKVVDEKVFTP